MRPYTIEEHWEAGVRASMLRPRLMWSSISPAQPAIRPKRKAVKAALSRASSENAPERQRCQCVFESNAAMTASMFAQKALGVTPRPSSPFSSAQTSRRSVRQRIPAIFLFSAFIAVRSQPLRVLVVEEVMLMCHHVARFDFAVARKGLARPCNEVCFWLLILPHASENRRVANAAISIWMKRRAAFIVLKPHLGRTARRLLKDGETPLRSGKPF